MLQETNIRFGSTSWKFLTSPNKIPKDALIDPFDWTIYQVVPPSDASSRPTLQNGGKFDPDRDDGEAFDAIHRETLHRAVAALPQNGLIVAGNTANLSADAEAEMADDDDPAEAAVAIGVNALAGTGGVGPCVAVLARAPVDQRWRVGCIHLSANDMDTFPLAAAAIDRLLTKLAGVTPDANTGPVELYVVGGCEDENVAYEEFGRVVAAIQTRAAAQDPVQVQFAGARIPACAGNRYVDVYIGGNGITYSVHQGR